MSTALIQLANALWVLLCAVGRCIRIMLAERVSFQEAVKIDDELLRAAVTQQQIRRNQVKR